MSHLHVQRKAVDLSVDEFIQNTVSLTLRLCNSIFNILEIIFKHV